MYLLQFQGCRFKPRNSLENGQRYHAGKMENLTKIAEIINVIEMKEATRLCIDFEPSCEKFWLYHYKTSCQDRFGICKWKYLKNYIDTYKICFNDN